MKKKPIIISSAIIVLILAIILLYPKKVDPIKINAANRITIENANFQVKEINDKESIDKIVSFLDSIKSKKSNFNGSLDKWTFSLKVSGDKDSTIIFIDDNMNLDGTWYKIDSTMISELQSIYDSFKVEEKVSR